MSLLYTAMCISYLTAGISAYVITISLTRRWNETRHRNDELTTRFLVQPENEDPEQFHSSEEITYPNLCIDGDMVPDGNELHIARGFERDPEKGYATFL